MKTTTPAPTPGALLSAARLAEIRAACAADTHPVARTEEGDDRRALLAHIDALQAPAPNDGGEALRDLMVATNDEAMEGWSNEDPEACKRADIAVALALDAHGYARGLAAALALAERDRDAEIAAIQEKWRACDGQLVQSYAHRAALSEEARDARAEIARLTAELGEARVGIDRWKVACERQGQANASADREDDKRVAAARLDGAREEREALIRHYEGLGRTGIVKELRKLDPSARTTEGRQGS